MNPKQYFVYITTNPGKTTLYTGLTNDLLSRLIEHRQNAGFSKIFAGRYQCHCLIYFEVFTDIHAAITREKEIKRWGRRKKSILVKAANPDWRFLNEDVQLLFYNNPLRGFLNMD